jgi:hypothetical protein
MKLINKSKKINRIIILPIIVLFIKMLLLPSFVYGRVDLPIDIDEVYQIEGMETRAVTVSRGIDLFSDSSREVTEAMINQREEVREEALSGLFDPLLKGEELTGEERLKYHVISSGLFREGVSFREGGMEEVVTEGTPIFLIVILLIMCGFGGFIIAMLSLRKSSRKEKRDVH